MSTAQRGTPPLYVRALRLRRTRPGEAVCFALFEGSVTVAGLLVLSETAGMWTLVGLPATVAALVKLNDLIGGAAASEPVLTPGACATAASHPEHPVARPGTRLAAWPGSHLAVWPGRRLAASARWARGGPWPSSGMGRGRRGRPRIGDVLAGAAGPAPSGALYRRASSGTFEVEQVPASDRSWGGQQIRLTDRVEQRRSRVRASQAAPRGNAVPARLVLDGDHEDRVRGVLNQGRFDR